MNDEPRKPYNFRFPPSLIDRVDRVAASGERTAWIEQAIKEKLGASQEIFGRYVCPREECEFRADSPKAVCPTHGAAVVAGG